MKTTKVMILFVALCVLSASLRELTSLDQMRGPNRRWIWLRSRAVIAEPEHFDFVFVGSSKTLNGVKPSLLAEELPGTRSLNLGHFKFGHDADYYAVERLLARHRVDRLVVEIPYDVVDEPHDATKNVIGPDELPGELRAALLELSWRDWLSYSLPLRDRAERISRYLGTLGFSLPTHAILYARAWITDTPYDKAGVNRRWDHSLGFDFNDKSLEQKKEFADYWKKHRHPRILVKPGQSIAGKLDHPSPGSRQDYYVKRLARLADAHGTQLSFVQIPGLWRQAPSLGRYAYYRAHGDVLVPDLTRLYRVEYYADSHHFYQVGTEVFTRELARLLRDGPQASRYFRLYREIDAAAREASRD